MIPDIPPMTTEQVLRQAGQHEDANLLVYANLDHMWFNRMRHFRVWGKAREL